ncbi:hypothetical protein [Rhodoferax sp. U11-2br]|uniref:hypothetical protein n=1 Tax=Rhodoferax sp. U11-2br TaxID=2838878 RepID=UPI001BE6BA7F|nr:hypothetical protein [Rhodoferax sp. U11-2br]MBT3067528.1 hypothetical protein [Rhodoferax sp. U11-2br]
MSLQASPCERLAASRERLRLALQQNTHTAASAGSQPESLLGGLLSHLQTGPGAGLVLDVLQAWWQKQPMRVALLLALETTKLLVQPIAQRHPYTLVLAAAAVGGLTVMLRPWRWISTPALLAGLMPQILSEVMKHLSRKPPASGTAPP